jgi:hypothetical protein
MSVKTPAERTHAESGGRHRRRGLIGRLYVARTVRVHIRRILGIVVVGVVAGIGLVAALATNNGGDNIIPSYQKQENPFLYPSLAPAARPACFLCPLPA